MYGANDQNVAKLVVGDLLSPMYGANIFKID